jgi:phosphatidylglycerophosphatase C
MHELTVHEGVASVAAFDFDGTLTRGDSLIPFLARGLGRPRLLLALAQCAPWLLAYALRLVPNHVAKARLLGLTLRDRRLSELAEWTQQWLALDLPGQWTPWALAQLRAHQQAGRCCVMVSASPDVYLTQVAKQLGFDAVICTEMEVRGRGADAHLTGRMRTANCHGAQKVARLQTWLNQQLGTHDVAYRLHSAYGDTSGDLPMLALAEQAWYRGKRVLPRP